jgi:hypothetical protein
LLSSSHGMPKCPLDPSTSAPTVSSAFNESSGLLLDAATLDAVCSDPQAIDPLCIHQRLTSPYSTLLFVQILSLLKNREVARLVCQALLPPLVSSHANTVSLRFTLLLQVRCIDSAGSDHARLNALQQVIFISGSTVIMQCCSKSDSCLAC